MKPSPSGQWPLGDTFRLLGALTAAQAGRLWDFAPETPEGALDAMVLAGQLLKWQGAYWFPKAPRQHTAHRLLNSEIFVRLSRCAELLAWDPPGPQGEGARADGWLTWMTGAGPVQLAVEADRGTETHQQWKEKLAWYRALSGRPPILVVTTGRVRARRIAHLIQTEYGGQAVSTTLKALVGDLKAWVPTASGAPSHAYPSRPPTIVAQIFHLGDRVIPESEAVTGLNRGLYRILGRERSHGTQHVWLATSKRQF